METLFRFSPWLSRFVLGAATLVFTLIAGKFITNPTGSGAVSGIVLSSPLAMTDMRVGFGAFPLAFAIVFAACLFSARRLLSGLEILAVVVGISLAVRLLGVVEDGTAAQSVPLLRAEGIMFVLALVAISVEFARRRRVVGIPFGLRD